MPRGVWSSPTCCWTSQIPGGGGISNLFSDDFNEMELIDSDFVPPVGYAFSSAGANTAATPSGKTNGRAKPWGLESSHSPPARNLHVIATALSELLASPTQVEEGHGVAVTRGTLLAMCQPLPCRGLGPTQPTMLPHLAPALGTLKFLGASARDGGEGVPGRYGFREMRLPETDGRWLGVDIPHPAGPWWRLGLSVKHSLKHIYFFGNFHGAVPG